MAQSSRKSLRYLVARLYNGACEHYLEKPWVRYFRRNTIYLMIETCLFLIGYWYSPNWAGFWYTIYGFCCLVHTALLIYFWHLNYGPLVQQRLVWAYKGFLGLVIFLGIRNFIFQSIWIDLLVIWIAFRKIWPHKKVIQSTSRMVWKFVKKNPNMKKYFLFYMAINLVNLAICSYYFVKKAFLLEDENLIK